jgi:hypothetical protein
LWSASPSWATARTAKRPPVPTFAGNAFFVSVRGSDGNPGSLAKPWRTVTFALTRLRPGDTLYVRGGTYFERPTVSVSGTAADPITIQSYPGETAVIDSGPQEFRAVGNRDWELVDSSTGEYRSVKRYEV